MCLLASNHGDVDVVGLRLLIFPLLMIFEHAVNWRIQLRNCNDFSLLIINFVG